MSCLSHVTALFVFLIAVLFILSCSSMGNICDMNPQSYQEAFPGTSLQRNAVNVTLLWHWLLLNWIAQEFPEFWAGIVRSYREILCCFVRFEGLRVLWFVFCLWCLLTLNLELPEIVNSFLFLFFRGPCVNYFSGSMFLQITHKCGVLWVILRKLPENIFVITGIWIRCVDVTSRVKEVRCHAWKKCV